MLSNQGGISANDKSCDMDWTDVGLGITDEDAWGLPVFSVKGYM